MDLFGSIHDGLTTLLWRQRTGVAVLALVVLLTLVGSSAGAGAAGARERDVAADPAWREKIHPRLLAAGAREELLDFIVVLEEQADAAAIGRVAGAGRRGTAVVAALRETAAASQGPLIALVAAHGGEHRAFWIANLLHVRGSAALLRALAERPAVRRVDANPHVRMVEPRSGPTIAKGATAVQWNIARIGADVVWQMGFDGQGVVVAAHDTGFDWGHEALAPQYRGLDMGVVDHAYNWHDAIHSGGGVCGADSPEPCADRSHGTHVMGTIAGDDGGTNRTGVAPGARWIGCRNMDVGDGTPATYTECFEWFVAPTDADNLNPDPSKAPHVINNSWICPTSEGCEPDTLKMVVTNVRAAGIVVVGASGNSGSDGCGSIVAAPAIYDATLTVGATDDGDGIAAFSSRGPVVSDGSGRMKPELTAPGVAIRSSVPSDGYSSFGGTSMASPHVVGVVALLLSARPDLKGRVDEIEFILEHTATGLVTETMCGDDVPGESIPNNAYGWGRVDALRAVAGDPDEDTVSTLTDCRPADPAAWLSPGPATDLVLTHSGTTGLVWRDSDSPGAVQVAHTAIRSTSANDFAVATCLANMEGLPGEGAAVDAETPADLFFYLVQVENACGATTGTMTADALRSTATCP